MVFIGTGDNDLFAVGDRTSNGNTPPANSIKVNDYDTNILYRFDSSTGAFSGSNRTNDARAYDGAGTTQEEIGQVTGLTFGESVTGMARIGGTTFAVTDFGRIMTINMGTAAGTTIALTGLNFEGLAAGPNNVEGGAYGTTLFAIEGDGTLHAFDTSGVAQAIFVDAQTSVSTGVTGVTGLDFSTLERNLWTLTDHREGDGGHGIDARYDNSVAPEEGGNSLYFGNTIGGAAAGNQNDLATGVIRDLNFPGGAHGSVVSNEFSLAGYSKHDKPTIYFNYFLETDGTNSTLTAQNMRDSFRVFVGEVGGTWDLIGTNNSIHSPGQTDEFDYGPDGATSTAPTTQNFPDVGELFDRSQWRQARIDLSNYAGRPNLRLRFDVNTGGSMDIGNINTRGSELYALDASSLEDGQAFVVDGQSFEFDMGRHMTVSSGPAVDGESFTLFGDNYVYSTTSSGGDFISILATDTADDVAAKTAAAINARGTTTATVTGNRVTVRTATAGDMTSASASLVLAGSSGITGDVAVDIDDATWSANDVAIAIRQALADNVLDG